MFIETMKEKLIGFIAALNRYPVVIVFVFAAAIVNFMMIQSGKENDMNLLFTFIIGASLGAVAQQIYERFFTSIQARLMLQVGAIMLTVGYYFTIRFIDVFNMELEVKTAVLLFAFVMVFIWVPSIKSKILFNETFMATFRAFFTTVLFTAVILAGVNLSIFAVDQLLTPVNFKVYSHVFNIVFTLFSPLFFLSFIPLYPGTDGQADSEQRARIEHATACPKILAILLSYVVIPLAGLYTLILVAYVLLNISGDFWTDNLLEPMLVAYAITIILVTILASSLNNTFALLFRKVLPKVLLPIVLFQLIASVLIIGDMGVTHGRYYVLLFGLFAFLTSIIFSFFKIEKSGWIAAILIVFSVISILPPIDAFTVSRTNQTNLLQKTLANNNMFKDGEIIPNADISIEDKRKITQTVNYLSQMGYDKKIDWLSDPVYFKQTFGFSEVYGKSEESHNGRSSYLDWGSNPVIDVAGYDRMIHVYVSNDTNSGQKTVIAQMEINGTPYRLEESFEDDALYFSVLREDETLMDVNMTTVFQQIMEIGDTLTVEEATVTEENDSVRMTVVAAAVDMYDNRYGGEVYLLVEIK